MESLNTSSLPHDVSHDASRRLLSELHTLQTQAPEAVPALVDCRKQAIEAVMHAPAFANDGRHVAAFREQLDILASFSEK